MRLCVACVLTLLVAAFLGCGSKPTAAPKQTNSAPPPPVVATPAPAPMPAPMPVPSAPADPAAPLPMIAGFPGLAPAPQSAAPAAPTSVAEIPGAKKAAVGMGKKGHYGGDGIIATPISVRFRAEEAIMLANMQKAMDIYKALNGTFPKTQEEFMEKIIKENQIRLPELPSNEEYAYDPEQGQLMVIPKQMK